MTVSSKIGLQNRIPLEGTNNFRDMGGYQTRDGRTIRHGLFYRSDELNRLTPADIEVLQSLSIRTILDYRDHREAIQKPGPVIEGIHYECIPAIQQEIAPFGSLEEMAQSSIFQQLDTRMFQEMYTQLPFQNASYQRLMSWIQDPKRLGLVHHCAVGKDRTGVGAALIYLALDVPQETIMEDYLLSNESLKEPNEQLLTQLASILDDTKLQKVSMVLTAKEEFLEGVFQAIMDKYGSVECFLKEEFGLTSEKRIALQNYCLD